MLCLASTSGDALGCFGMPRPRTHDIQVAIRMPEALRDKLQVSATTNNRSLAAEARRAVELYLGEKTRRGTR